MQYLKKPKLVSPNGDVEEKCNGIRIDSVPLIV